MRRGAGAATMEAGTVMALTNRQRVFVELYLTLWNATEAARRAGYSERTANEQAARLLAKVSVREAIEKRVTEHKATADEVLMRLTSHSRGTMDDFLNGFGLIDIQQARERGVMPLIKKIKQRTTTISKESGEDIETHDIELELYDAQAATVQLGRALGVFAADQQPPIVVNNNLAVIGVRAVDYRAGLADLAPGPISDSDALSADESPGDGPALGEDGLGRDIGS